MTANAAFAAALTTFLIVAWMVRLEMPMHC